MTQDINTRIRKTAHTSFWRTIDALNKGKARDEKFGLKDYLDLLSMLTPRQAAEIIKAVSPKRGVPVRTLKGV